MTIRYMSEYNIEGLYTDLKPTWKGESTANGYLPAGAKFYEVDTKRTYTFDGAGTWYLGPGVNYYADSRQTIAISTTSTATFSGTQFVKSGERLTQYVATCGDTTNAVALTRTFYIYSGTTATVYFTSTAQTDAATSVRTLGTSEGCYLDGTYDVRWVVSAVSETCTTDYLTLFFGR